MDYTQLFDSLYPGFFRAESIRALPGDLVYTELVMDLRGGLPHATSSPCLRGITFGEYHGDLLALRDAVRQVDEDWVQYFEEGNRFYCAFDGERIVSFCNLDDMVRLATETLRQDGFDLSWIHYTHLAHWYMRLGYQPVLEWNSGGIFPNME